MPTKLPRRMPSGALLQPVRELSQSVAAAAAAGVEVELLINSTIGQIRELEALGHQDTANVLRDTLQRLRDMQQQGRRT